MKRIELTSVQSSQKPKKVKKKVTYRINLTLGESTPKTCPEYSFADLIKNQRISSIDPFDTLDDDSDVAAIAQKFEAKYGPKSINAGKKKWTQEMDDYCDLGEGYDEEDTFIDNTEAYDEVVPSTIITEHGGFYINQGKLDFKSLHEDSVDENVTIVLKKKKKKRIISSDNDEDEFETGASLAKQYKAIKRKKLLESKETEKKRKQPIGPEGELIIKKKKKKNLEKLKLKKTEEKAPPQKEISPLPPMTATNVSTPVASTEVASAADPAPKTDMVTNSTSDNHEALASKDLKSSIEETVSAILQETLKDDSSSKSGEEGKSEQQSGEKTSVLPTQLPSQLPPELQEAIDIIKKEAKESKEGKTKFFSADINKLLLDIELGTRNLPWGSRTTIYKHLSEYLPCGTHALQRRAKKLRELQQEDQLKFPTQKLKEAIMKEMPALEEQHELDVARAKMEAEQKEDNPEILKEEASTESEEEEKVETAKKKPRGPRRKFQWTSEIKDLLLEIVSTKMKLFNSSKTKNQTAEEYLKAYLDADIKPLWPQGWMQTRMLFKTTRSAHDEMTKTPQSKQKKNVTAQPTSEPVSEPARTHVSKTEDVIEITGDRTETVVVNLSNSDVKPLPTFTSPPAHQKVTESPHGDILSSGGRKPLGRPVSSTPPWVVLQQANIPSLTQKYNETPVSTKRITPVPITDSSHSTPSSPGANQTPKLMTPIASGAGSAKHLTPASNSGSSVAEPVTPTESYNSGRSFLTAFQNFKDTYTMPDSLLAAEFHQRFATNPPESLPPKSVGQKIGTTSQLPHNSSAVPPKLPLDLKAPHPHQQKAAVKSHQDTVHMDIPTSSWSDDSSVITAVKPASPVVSAARSISTFPKNTVSLINKDTNPKFSQVIEKQVQLLQVKQQAKLSPADKSPHNISQKKRQQSYVHLPSTSPVHTKAIISLLPSNKLSQSSSLHSTSKTDNLQQQRNAAGPSLNSLAASKPYADSSQLYKPSSVAESAAGTNIQYMHVLGTSFSQMQQSKIGKQPFSQISPPKSHKAPSPTSLTLAHLSNPLLLQSRGSTPSPQKSPLSPENPSLSLYEQIHSQIRQQEAVEGQALKNLAMANIYRGVKPATDRNTNDLESNQYASAANETIRKSEHFKKPRPVAHTNFNSLPDARSYKNNVSSSDVYSTHTKKESEKNSRSEKVTSALPSGELSLLLNQNARTDRRLELEIDFTLKDKHLKNTTLISVLKRHASEASALTNQPSDFILTKNESKTTTPSLSTIPVTNARAGNSKVNQYSSYSDK